MAVDELAIYDVALAARGEFNGMSGFRAGGFCGSSR